MTDSSDEEDGKAMHAVMTFRKGRTYTIESNIDSTAKKEAVLDVLTDYPSHPDVFSSIHSSRVVTRDQNEAHVLQEGRWNVLWLSGRFQTLVRMREDLTHGRVTSRSLKSTIFHSHEGEWEVLPKASGGCQISHIATSRLKGRLPPGLGRYLAGSFLSEENKIMIELKQAAEQRSAKEQHRPQKHANAPFGWILPPMRRDW
ncbi:hypothetical protein ABBQ38_001345 [Trebouxia sp. C0009 RCD-2024]